MKYFVTVVLLAMFAVASTHATLKISEEKDVLSPGNAEENIQSITLKKRSSNGDNEGIIAASEVEKGREELAERIKRTVLHTGGPVAYTAYSSPYAYARSYVYPYVASPYVASPYVASPYRTYPYVYNSPYYF